MTSTSGPPVAGGDVSGTGGGTATAVAAQADVPPPVKRQTSVVFVEPLQTRPAHEASPTQTREPRVERRATAPSGLNRTPQSPSSIQRAKRASVWEAGRKSAPIKAAREAPPPQPTKRTSVDVPLDLDAMLGEFVAVHKIDLRDDSSEYVLSPRARKRAAEAAEAARSAASSKAEDADDKALKSPTSLRKSRAARKAVERPYYEGETTERLRHGKGKYCYRNAFFTYEGDWVNGVKHGQGKLTMLDGSYYEGSFEMGEIVGFGFKRYANGNTYSGQFFNGELHGHGTMIYYDGSKFEGEWKRNAREGEGILTDKQGNVYDGIFRRNRMNGKGTFLGRSGEFYDGEWRDGQRSGYGRITYPTSEEYEGEWALGKEHGHGTLLHPSGVSYDGLWEYGKPIACATQCVPYVPRFEIKRDDTFTLNIECQDDTEETVKQESGRLVRITVIKTEIRPVRVDSAQTQRPNTAGKGLNSKDKRAPRASMANDRRTSLFPAQNAAAAAPTQPQPVTPEVPATPDVGMEIAPKLEQSQQQLDYVPGGFVDPLDPSTTVDYFEARTKSGVVIFANLQLSKAMHGETEISVVEMTEPMYRGKRLRPAIVQVNVN